MTITINTTNRKKNSMSLPHLKLISYAQNSEDIVLHRAFKDQPPGFYVDLGAGHPERGSVTKLLYDHLDWTGLDVEPLPYLIDELKMARPKSKVLNIAVSATNSPDTVPFFEFPEDWTLSTLDPDIAAAHQARGLKARHHLLPCLTINEILQAHKVVKNFDLLKVDIEGKDFAVLQSLDYSRWTPKVILVEALCPVKKIKQSQVLIQLLEPHGYQEVLYDGINSFFLHKNAQHLIEELSLCANALDYFINHRWWSRLPQDIKASYPHLIQQATLKEPAAK
jgi:FkbM family methyltransferase